MRSLILFPYRIQSAQPLPSNCTTKNPGRTVEILKIPTQTGVDIFEVYCELGDLDEKPWLVVFLRKEPRYEYGRWQDYTQGYNTLSGNYFIGLQRLHAITHRQSHELTVQLAQSNGTQHYMHFEHFAIGDETSIYGVSTLGPYVATMQMATLTDWLPWHTKPLHMITRMKISIRPVEHPYKRKPKGIGKIKRRVKALSSVAQARWKRFVDK